MSNRLTITDILAMKEQAKPRQLKKQQLFIPSLNAEITVQEPTKTLIMEAAEQGTEKSDPYIIYQCVIDPNLKQSHKQLMEHFGCAEPIDVVDRLFRPAEVTEIAQKILELAGYSPRGAGVKIVDEIKNS